MNNEELRKHLMGILTGSASEQDSVNFKDMLIQIAKEGCGEIEIKPNPVCEALETLDDFLEELDESCGLAALRYGSESYEAMEILYSWYYEQLDKNEVIEYLLNMLEEEHIGMRAVAIKQVKDKFDIEL